MSEPNRVAMAESYRFGFEAGKAEQEATIAKLTAEIAQYKAELKETVLTALRFNPKLKADALTSIQGTKRTGKGGKT